MFQVLSSHIALCLWPQLQALWRVLCARLEIHCYGGDASSFLIQHDPTWPSNKIRPHRTTSKHEMVLLYFKVWRVRLKCSMKDKSKLVSLTPVQLFVKHLTAGLLFSCIRCSLQTKLIEWMGCLMKSFVFSIDASVQSALVLALCNQPMQLSRWRSDDQGL